MAGTTLLDAANGGDAIAAAITREIERRITLAIDSEAAGIADRVIRRLREDVGQITGGVLSHYEMEHSRNVITIRVQVGPDTKKEPG